MATPDEKAPRKKQPKTQTDYRVLRWNDPPSGRDTWTEAGLAVAGSADAAIRRVVARLSADDQPGTYVAIPERSFAGAVEVSLQTTTQLVFDGREPAPARPSSVVAKPEATEPAPEPTEAEPSLV